MNRCSTKSSSLVRAPMRPLPPRDWCRYVSAARALDVAGMAHRDEHVGVGDQIFELDLIDLVDDLRAAVVAVRLLHFLQLAGDDRLQFLVARKNFFEFRDVLADRLQFLQDFVDRQLRQAMQLQFENRVHLHRRQADHAAARRDRFAFQRTDLVLAAVELHAGDLLLLAVLGDRHVLLGKILEQVFLGLRAARWIRE